MFSDDLGVKFWAEPADTASQRKFVDRRKTKIFGFRWNWDEEKKLRGIRLQSSSLPNQSPHLFMTDNDAPSLLGGGGQDFVDSIIAVKTRKG
jgi:hypothetical protein